MVQVKILNFLQNDIKKSKLTKFSKLSKKIGKIVLNYSYTYYTNPRLCRLFKIKIIMLANVSDGVMSSLVLDF